MVLVNSLKLFTHSHSQMFWSLSALCLVSCNRVIQRQWFSTPCFASRVCCGTQLAQRIFSFVWKIPQNKSERRIATNALFFSTWSTNIQLAQQGTQKGSCLQKMLDSFLLPPARRRVSFSFKELSSVATYFSFHLVAQTLYVWKTRFLFIGSIARKSTVSWFIHATLIFCVATHI